MDVSHDRVIGFIYGELPPDEARGVERAIASDPVLAAFAAEQRRIKDTLDNSGRTHPDHDVAPAPPLSRGTAKPWIAAAALGAGLILGFGLAGTFDGGNDIRNRDGRLVAAGDLARTLSQSLASTRGTEDVPTIGASIWSSEGRFCRSFAFRAADKQRLSGIACRETAQWRIVLLDARAADSDSAISPAVANALAAMRTGGTLDAAAERAARAQDWRPR